MNLPSVSDATASIGSEQNISPGSVFHLEDVSISYRVTTERTGISKQGIIRRAKGRVHKRTFWAQKGVKWTSIEVK